MAGAPGVRNGNPAVRNVNNDGFNAPLDFHGEAVVLDLIAGISAAAFAKMLLPELNFHATALAGSIAGFIAAIVHDPDPRTRRASALSGFLTGLAGGAFVGIVLSHQSSGLVDADIPK